MLFLIFINTEDRFERQMIEVGGSGAVEGPDISNALSLCLHMPLADMSALALELVLVIDY